MESDPRKAFQEKVREVHEVGLLQGLLLRDCTREGDKQGRMCSLDKMLF